MKKALLKITAVCMAFVVLFSTMSFTISSHFCGGSLVDVSYFGAADSCGMELQKNTSSKECSVSKKNCCTDTVDVIQGQDTLKKSASESLTFEQHVFVTAYVYSYATQFENLHNKVIPFASYAPPLLVRNIHVLDQVFLI